MTPLEIELLSALREAKQAVYCYEQTLLADCRNDTAKIYTDMYQRFKALIAKAEGKSPS